MIWVAVLLSLPEIDIEQYLPPAPKPIECNNLSTYPVQALPFDKPTLMFYNEDSGDLKTIEMQPGYLVSECELMQIAGKTAELKRLRKELETLRALRTREFELWRVMEQEYQEQLRTPETWFDRYRLEIGILVGVVATSITTVSIVQILKAN